MVNAQTRVNYAKSINAVAHFIDQYYEKKITLADLAGIANISEFHFGRILQSCIGESPTVAVGL